ncbi:sulfotransferase [soil metagenome]
MSELYPSIETMMGEAQTRAGLSDFGAPTFVNGLVRMRESLIAEVPFEAEDRAKATELMIRRLVNRLQIEAWFAKNPEAENAKIEGPVSITGLPRTGTTALGNMLSLDPQFRPLRAWEQVQPFPPPQIEDEANDSRRIAYRDGLAALLRAQPELAAMHLYDLDATMEDTEILGLEFRAQQMTMPVFGYQAWWRDGDMRETFAYHARVARMLQSSRPPNRWLFKAPHHKFHLEDMVDAYPDVRFVFTHRDPGKSIPSYASFVASLFPAYVTQRLGREYIGRAIHQHLLIGMQRAVAARERLGPKRFLDVHHEEFIAQPIAVIERIYNWLGLELTAEVRAEFERWYSENRTGAHGAHRYTPEEFGLSAAAIRDDYDFYIKAFDVESRAGRNAA